MISIRFNVKEKIFIFEQSEIISANKYCLANRIKMRRGRAHLVKIVLSVVIVLAVFYILFSDSDAHSRAKQAINARFMAKKPKDKPILVQGKEIKLIDFFPLNLKNLIPMTSSFRARKL